jgi:membrane fusion protein, multidrug efflux system
MPYLQEEKARLQAEVQAIGIEIANLTSQERDQQQAISAAQARVVNAQANLANAKAQLPALEAAAATADRRIGDVNEAIAAHEAIEPEKTIEVPNKPPRPNPDWIAWNKALGRLNEQLDRAQADAATAHARVNEGMAQVSRAAAEVQAALHVTQLAIAAARQRQATAQARVADVDRWNDEIARDVLARKTLEQVAAELSKESAVLEDAHAVARVQNEIAEETLSSLSARRDQLTPALNQVNAQLPAATEELRATRAVLAAATRSIQKHRQRGPKA